MKYAHSMPFGAEYLGKEGVRFQLWAPTAQNVTLCLHAGGSETLLQMTKSSDGWYRLTVSSAQPGDRYQYQIDNGMKVPDPASRYNPADVHGPSMVIDPHAFEWQDDAWAGRPWHEAVIYELHTGTFTPEGSFRAAIDRLDYLVDLGITAIELMPIADFPGARNWGYDGVLLFAPDASYGHPDDLKALVQAAHARGLMVLLDVVYNHFGPEGNYLHVYAKDFFTERHHTPWGAAINFDDRNSRTVRDFFIHNALFWLAEYRFDGLRLDAVHAILDDSQPDILEELAHTVRHQLEHTRPIHLVLENDHNAAHYLKRTNHQATHYTAQWNDDIHHAWHVLLTQETDGYYREYVDTPAMHLARCLGEGFAWQGEPSPFRRGDKRGEPSGTLPPVAFVNFLQNHDQIGNRAWGERLLALADPEALKAAVAAQLLAPAPPLLFMGEEFGATTPFQFFCDFGPDLRDAVCNGRRREFAQFSRFSDPATLARIPDPGAVQTFEDSKLNWTELDQEMHQDWLRFYRTLLALRARAILPYSQLATAREARAIGPRAVQASWQWPDHGRLTMLCNLDTQALPLTDLPPGQLLFAQPDTAALALDTLQLPAYSCVWYRKPHT